MNMRRVYVLLAAWCIFLIGPGMLVVSGVFGHFDRNSDISGLVIMAWVGGYLAQLMTFMWLMNIVGKQKILWWFVASLLPWGIDWTLPVSPLYALLWVPVTIAMAGWVALVAQRADALQQGGIRATGVVLEVLKPWMNVVINSVYIRRKVRLRIEREDGAPSYEGILKGLFMLGEIPSAGDRLPLIVDPKNPQRFEYQQGADTQPAAPSHYTAAPSHHAAASATPQGSFADELTKLADLHDRGALTDSEFDAAKKKLLRH